MFWFLFIFFIASQQIYALDIPGNLSSSDQEEVVRILGLGTSTKILTNPYPLGGYPGLEIGVSLEVVDTSDLGRLGDKATVQKEFRYPKMTIGKGLYNNIDIFIQFSPYDELSEFSEYGGFLKWSFYQAKFLPISLSVLLHGNYINVNDAFINETLGANLQTGIVVDNFSVHFGVGQLQAMGKFIGGGGIDAIVAGNEVIESKVNSTHTYVGLSFHVSSIFAALQMDRYKDPVYSFKMGLRL